MRVALISRATLFTVKGGDSVQVNETARHLNLLGIEAEIILSNKKIVYEKYDLLHFFNITRPADILRHIKKTNKPFIVTPVWIDYSAYDKFHRKGIAAALFNKLTSGKIEYIKVMARWLKGKDSWPGLFYLVKGQHKSISIILKKAALLLTNSESEFEVLNNLFPNLPSHMVIPLGIDEELFQYDSQISKQENMVICVARIEGIKNQLNLIKALNNTSFQLYLIGAAAPNHQQYYTACKKTAGDNITFIEQLPQEKVKTYYQKAKVHVLPSWYESCGLASMEAAAMGCNIVGTRNGFASSYFHEDALYCDPSLPSSILSMVEQAARKETTASLQQQITTHFTWKQAAIKTIAAYKKILPEK